MTTPGQQLTPGDDQNPPVYGVPDGAYVGTAGQSNSITDLNNLTEAEAKNRMKSSIAGPFGRQRDGVWGFFSLITGVVQGVVDVVVGGVTAIVDGIGQIFNSIGSLFGAARQDTSAVDAARVAGENAIVANMSESLDQLDEIQRFGGAYMGYETFSIFNGETYARVLPLSETVPLGAGTSFIPPHTPLTHSSKHQYAGEPSGSILARGSGQLELLESGLWMIFFQGSFLQGPAYTNRPVHMWCHVTPADDVWLPVGPPELLAGGDPNPAGQMARHRETGEHTSDYSAANVAAFGRAASYTRDISNQISMGGGMTLFGMTYAYLESGGWKVSLSDMSFEKHGGAASTFVYAQKVNSETLRDDIETLKLQIAAALPGQSTDKLLDEASIAAMVAEAGNLEVPDVVVPTDPPEAGNG